MLADLWHNFGEFVSGLFHWVESLAESPGAAWSLFAIALAESSFFPIPPDVLLIALCVARPEDSFFFAMVCSVGSILGGILGYGIGYVGGRPVLHKMFSERKIARVKGLYDKYNAWATGIAGLTPLPYKIFTIAGGTFEVNFKIFLLASVAARSARFFAVAGLIFWIGEPAKLFIEKYLNVLSIAFVVLLGGSFWLVSRWLENREED